MIADVDRMVVGEDAGLECKTVSAYGADKWKDGQIPVHYLLPVPSLYGSNREKDMVHCRRNFTGWIFSTGK